MEKRHLSILSSRGCIESAKKNESRIKELIDTFGATESRSGQQVIRSTPSASAKTAIAGPSDSYEDIVEVLGDTVKFVAKNAYALSTKEAAGLLMYFWNKPLQPKGAEDMLSRGWKKVNNLRNYFVDEKQLKPYVIKQEEGYLLAGNGKRWILDEVIPKSRGQLSAKS